MFLMDLTRRKTREDGTEISHISKLLIKDILQLMNPKK